VLATRRNGKTVRDYQREELEIKNEKNKRHDYKKIDPIHWSIIDFN
jgi:hypothetical protein